MKNKPAQIANISRVRRVFSKQNTPREPRRRARLSPFDRYKTVWEHIEKIDLKPRLACD